jgi:hypothetical protein
MCVECDVPHSTYKNIKINKGKEKREWKEMGKHQECRDRQSMKCLVFPARANTTYSAGYCCQSVFMPTAYVYIHITRRIVIYTVSK